MAGEGRSGRSEKKQLADEQQALAARILGDTKDAENRQRQALADSLLTGGRPDAETKRHQEVDAYMSKYHRRRKMIRRSRVALGVLAVVAAVVIVNLGLSGNNAHSILFFLGGLVLLIAVGGLIATAVLSSRLLPRGQAAPDWRDARLERLGESAAAISNPARAFVRRGVVESVIEAETGMGTPSRPGTDQAP